MLLYEEEYNKKYVTDLFGAFLPTEKETWAKEMAVSQQTVQTRITMVGGDIHEAASRLMFNIIKGHKLADGNKRSSILCMIGFYTLNNYKVKFDNEDLYHKAKEIAALDSQTIDDEQEIANLTKFLKDNTKPLLRNSLRFRYLVSFRIAVVPFYSRTVVVPFNALFLNP